MTKGSPQATDNINDQICTVICFTHYIGDIKYIYMPLKLLEAFLYFNVFMGSFLKINVRHITHSTQVCEQKLVIPTTQYILISLSNIVVIN